MSPVVMVVVMIVMTVVAVVAAISMGSLHAGGRWVLTVVGG